MFGENSRAISTLTQLLQTPYISWLYGPGLLRRPFLGSIRSGTLCAAIPLSKNSARKSSRDTNHELKTRITRISTNRLINWCELVKFVFCEATSYFVSFPSVQSDPGPTVP